MACTNFFRTTGFPSGSYKAGARLNYADISLTEITDVTIDENTDNKDINLLSKGYYEWEDVRQNKNLIKTILNNFDPKNLDPKIGDKILHSIILVISRI